MKFLVFKQNEEKGILKTKEEIRLGWVCPIRIIFANSKIAIGFTRDKEGLKRMGLLLGGIIRRV